MLKTGQRIISPRLNSPKHTSQLPPSFYGTLQPNTARNFGIENGDQMRKSISTARPRSPKRVIPKLRDFTCCTATQPLIASYGELSTAIREFLLYNSSNPIIGDFPDKFAQMTPVFELYCQQTASLLSMVNRAPAPPTLMVSTVKLIRQTIADLYQGYQKLSVSGVQNHSKAIEDNFNKLNRLFNGIRRTCEQDHFYDDSALIALPQLKKQALNLKNKGLSLIGNGAQVEQIMKYADDVKQYSRKVITYLHRSLPMFLFPSKDKVRLRNEAIAYLGAVSEIVESSRELPQQIDAIGKALQKFGSLLEKTNAEIGMPLPSETNPQTQPIQPTPPKSPKSQPHRPQPVVQQHEPEPEPQQEEHNEEPPEQESQEPPPQQQEDQPHEAEAELPQEEAQQEAPVAEQQPEESQQNDAENAENESPQEEAQQEQETPQQPEEPEGESQPQEPVTESPQEEPQNEEKQEPQQQEEQEAPQEEEPQQQEPEPEPENQDQEAQELPPEQEADSPQQEQGEENQPQEQEPEAQEQENDTPQQEGEPEPEPEA